MTLVMRFLLIGMLAMPQAVLPQPTATLEQSMLEMAFHDHGANTFLAELERSRAAGHAAAISDATKFLELRSLRIVGKTAEALALIERMESEEGFISPESRARLGGIDGRREIDAASDMLEVIKAYQSNYFQVCIDKADLFHMSYPKNWRRPEVEFHRISSIYQLRQFAKFHAMANQYLADPEMVAYGRKKADRLLFMKSNVFNLQGDPSQAIRFYEKMSPGAEWRDERSLVYLKAALYSNMAASQAALDKDGLLNYDQMVDNVLAESQSVDRFVWFEEALYIGIRWRLRTGRVETLPEFVSRNINTASDLMPKTCRKIVRQAPDDLWRRGLWDDSIRLAEYMQTHLEDESLREEAHESMKKLIWSQEMMKKYSIVGPSSYSNPGDI